MNILNTIKNWRLKYKKLKYIKKFNAGYDYASGILLRNESTPIHLEAYYFNIHKTAFDDGIDEAIEFLCKNNIIKDDRF